MSLKVKLGKRIQDLRNMNKYSQDKFSEKIGINRNSLSKIETGETYPKPETLEKIKDILEVDYKDLFTFNENKNERVENINMKLQKIDDNQLHFIDSLLDTLIKNSI